MKTRAITPTPWLAHFNLHHSVEVTGGTRTLYLSGQTSTAAGGATLYAGGAVQDGLGERERRAEGGRNGPIKHSAAEHLRDRCGRLPGNGRGRDRRDQGRRNRDGRHTDRRGAAV